MKVKGSAVTSTSEFIKNKFAERYDEWLNSLLPQSREIIAGDILPSMWYPMNEGFIEPTRKLCDLFYEGKSKGAWEVGKFSAEMGLKKFYRVFLKFGSPHFLIKRASSIFSLYYTPSKIEVTKEEAKMALLKIVEFPEPSKLVEARIAGWIEKALELTKGNNPVLKINKSLADGDNCTEIRISWS